MNVQVHVALVFSKKVCKGGSYKWIHTLSKTYIETSEFYCLHLVKKNGSFTEENYYIDMLHKDLY
jgi:hypothetical protein